MMATEPHYQRSWARRVARLAVGVFALSLGIPVAHAEPGDHIRVGNATITPSLDAGLEYRTNPMQVEANPIGGANLRLAPRIDVRLESDEVDLRIGGQYELRKYFSARLVRLDRFSDFAVDGAVEVLKDQPLGFYFADTAGYRNNASGDDAGSYQSQFRNRFDGAAVFRIGPTLSIRTGGFYAADNYFVPLNGDRTRQRSYNFRDAYGPTWTVDWKFFPRTAVVLQGEYTLNRWGSNLLSTQNPNQPLGGVLVIPDSNQFKTQAGLRGRITERLTLVIMGGYGFSDYKWEGLPDEGAPDPGTTGYYQSTTGIDELLVTTQLGYEFGVGQRITVGYRKDFQDAWFTNFVTYNELYGRFNGRIGSRIGVDSSIEMRYEDFYGQVTRNDIRLRAKGDLTYYVQDYASITAGVWWVERASFQDPSVEFDDVNIHLLGTFTY